MENNKILAEYLGYEVSLITNVMWVISPHDEGFDDDLEQINWKPNKDWNQLMLVVEGIRNEKNDPLNKSGTDNTDFIYDIHDILTMLANSFIGRCDYEIEDLCNACVEYIKSK